jgi:hypothetical protein
MYGQQMKTSVVTTGIVSDQTNAHSPFFSIILYVLSGFVFVSGYTVVAAQNFIFSPKKIEKLKNNINQLQLTCGHYPETSSFKSAHSPFLPYRFFSGNPFCGLLSFTGGIALLPCLLTGQRRLFPKVFLQNTAL